MINFEHVSFSYDESENDTGLKNINLHIPSGQVVLLCGESGCGKTTVTRLINGLIPHYYEGKLSGKVQICGKEVAHFPMHEAARLVGSVFQNPRSQFFTVDTTSELVFAAENRGMPPEDIKQRLKESVELFGLQHLLNRSIFQLSGGEKQKLACASATFCDVPILVMDEPSSNLDAAATLELRKMLTIWKKQGKTIIIAEHRLHFLLDIIDRVLYIKNGAIVREFTGEEMRALPDAEIAKMGLRPLKLDGLLRLNSSINGTEDFTLSRVSHSYRRTAPPALEISELSLPKNNIIALVGHNGAGKSTFAQCLCGITKKSRGKLIIDGLEVASKECLGKCYMVMQDVNHQLFTESVIDEVILSMPEPDEDQAEKILHSLDLSSLKERHPQSLSGGQKQRVAIASAVASEREFIIFDEPTSGLDLRHMREVSDNLKALQSRGKTLFIITHDLELIMDCCTHILHLEKGQVAGSYPLDEMGEKYVKDFFRGQSAADEQSA